MLRRGEAALVTLCLAAFVLAAWEGLRHAPAQEETDLRLSSNLAGPNGAKGFAAALRRLGLRVEQRRYPLFDLADASTHAEPWRVFAFLDIEIPTDRELVAVRDYVARGGRVFVAGYTGIERCFGYRVSTVRAPAGRGAPGGERGVRDSAAVTVPAAGWTLPPARYLLRPIPAESLRAGAEDEDQRCAPRLAAGTDTLLRTRRGTPVALRLTFPHGGTAVLLADPRFVTNRALKETDAGLVVLPWFLDGRIKRVTVDEYHQGFGENGWLFGAVWRWLVANPAGWTMLQLCAVALAALAVAAARFGPARAVIERRRRSPLEHLEALAAGLESAGGADTAVALAVSGLRRRLGRTGQGGADDARSWLAALELALPTPRGRDAVRRLQRLVSQPGGGERVLATAQAVEDVWEELRPRTTRDAS